MSLTSDSLSDGSETIVGSMMSRRGERRGWTLGWCGGFLWVPLLAVTAWFQGKAMHGLVGLAIAATAALAILVLAPWRHPRVRYRWLMLPLYGLLLVALLWAVWMAGSARALGITGWWSALLLLPLTMPLWLIGPRRWEDGDR